MYFIIGIFLIAVTLLLYISSRRLFFLSVFLIYPIAAQMVTIDVDLSGAHLNISMLYGSILFAVCLLELLQQLARHRIREDRGLSLISTLFLFSCFASILLSSDKYESILTSIKISTWILLLLVSRDVFCKKGDLVLISKLAIVTSGIIAVSYIAAKLGLYGSASGGYKYYDYRIQVAVGHFYNAVSFAYPLAVCIPIILINVYLFNNKYGIAAVVLSIFVILLTYVRAPLVALGPGFLAFAHYMKKYKLRSFSKIVVLVCAFFVIVFIVFQYMEPRTATRRWLELREQVQTGELEKLGSGRFGLAMNALKYQLEKQSLLGHCFGIGIGNSASISRSKKVVHNSILEVWLGCGILGLILYVSFMYKLWSNIRIQMKESGDRRIQTAGALATMNFFVFLAANMDVILAAVFPMSLIAIHVGATLGVAQAQEVTAMANVTSCNRAMKQD